ncbi:acetylgalactosaminyl-diphospho-UDP glucuronosyltransferase [Lelliottia sp. F153]|uniref:glycosyltransferase n=1 Tax=unclassified Lelliottia TaxID=2642424 RepID=UPI000C7F15F5|nr:MULTISPECIES: glycosyltransferase [unclassified Lelliottia]PLY47334.1 acetylgalactosaminyl-diphospho-UDP glucuronosyltransferase [Lelliottia sp. F159]PLY51452.1 acetylgalactosaminyl-diphospho-UDP glucuronosyltransferase [Lelliottia sp. F154]PLY54398.1 acetylgalactosaminyl-diphospho-UDP glucuronosyltransferase [Lelliottia sp. F153]
MSLVTEQFSVLISIYKDDEPRYLEVALRSIYDIQTRKPEQIVIVADGQLAQAQIDVIESFGKEVSERLITFVQLPQNVGLAAALNAGLHCCRNEYVARMDADDISLPARFERQIDFFQHHPDIDVCGTYIDEIDTTSEEYISTRKVPLSHKDIVIFAKKRSAVSHPSVMFKKSTVLSVGGYPSFRKSQDFALWSLLLVNNAKFANIPEVLLKMRSGRDLMARRGISYLKYELQVMSFQRNINFITTAQFLKFALLRTVFRITPGRMKKALYQIVRNRQG